MCSSDLSEAIVRILKNLESDDAIAILENVEEKDKNSILSALPPKDRFALLEGLSYPEDSAARIMQREFTAIPSNWSVGQTIDYLRENKDLPEEFLEIYIVDDSSMLSPMELRARARRIARQEPNGLSLIVVDYLQLMQIPGSQENRVNQISEISRSLKMLAKELNIPEIGRASCRERV